MPKNTTSYSNILTVMYLLEVNKYLDSDMNKK
jgi:hypothetical protein